MGQLGQNKNSNSPKFKFEKLKFKFKFEKQSVFGVNELMHALYIRVSGMVVFVKWPENDARTAKLEPDIVRISIKKLNYQISLNLLISQSNIILWPDLRSKILNICMHINHINTQHSSSSKNFRTVVISIWLRDNVLRENTCVIEVWRWFKCRLGIDKRIYRR